MIDVSGEEGGRRAGAVLARTRDVGSLIGQGRKENRRPCTGRQDRDGRRRVAHVIGDRTDAAGRLVGRDRREAMLDLVQGERELTQNQQQREKKRGAAHDLSVIV